MKCRIRRTSNNLDMWFGEVFENGHWEKVTDDCFTKLGAKHELKKYVNAHQGIEFDI